MAGSKNRAYYRTVGTTLPKLQFLRECSWAPPLIIPTLYPKFRRIFSSFTVALCSIPLPFVRVSFLRSLPKTMIYRSQTSRQYLRLIFPCSHRVDHFGTESTLIPHSILHKHLHAR